MAQPFGHLYEFAATVKTSPSCSWRVIGCRAVTLWPTCSCLGKSVGTSAPGPTSAYLSRTFSLQASSLSLSCTILHHLGLFQFCYKTLDRGPCSTLLQVLMSDLAKEGQRQPARLPKGSFDDCHFRSCQFCSHWYADVTQVICQLIPHKPRSVHRTVKEFVHAPSPNSGI